MNKTIKPFTKEERQASILREATNKPWSFHKSATNKPGGNKHADKQS